MAPESQINLNTTNPMPRPISAFSEYLCVKQAYAHIRECLKNMVQKENRPELGAIDPPLWHYMHSCVPGHFDLPELGKAATAIGPRCTKMIMPLLVSGKLTPHDYAARIMDPYRFQQFIRSWISRDLGSRPLGKKRAQSLARAIESDLTA